MRFAGWRKAHCKGMQYGKRGDVMGLQRRYGILWVFWPTSTFQDDLLQLWPVGSARASVTCRAVSPGGLLTDRFSDMKTRPAGIGNANADWMGSLPPKLSAMPLKHIAVPGEPVVRKDVFLSISTVCITTFFFLLGSHDSFTFWVDVDAPVGPDQKPYVKYLATMFSVLAKKVMVKWSMTQVELRSVPCTKHIKWHN